MAFTLVFQMRTQRHRWFWQGLTLGLLLISLGSSTSGVLADSWWGWSEHEKQMPTVIHQSDRPLVVVAEPFYDGFRLAHEFDPAVEFLFLEDLQALQLPSDRPQIFVMLTYPTPDQVAFLQQLNRLLSLAYRFYDPSTHFELVIYRLISSK
jgi:hypothetical protein